MKEGGSIDISIEVYFECPIIIPLMFQVITPYACYLVPIINGQYLQSL